MLSVRTILLFTLSSVGLLAVDAPDSVGGKIYHEFSVQIRQVSDFNIRFDADGGVTMKDMGVLAAGNLMGGGSSIGQMIQKQIGQTGIPVYNVANACATGATALRTAIMAMTTIIPMSLLG